MTAYYNEFDPFAAAWLRELIKADLIAAGDVDERSITEVTAADLAGYTQCHFFAGIGGWSYALRLAGWPDNRPVWTGSCPCQPFSQGGPGDGGSSKRHLWPSFFALIQECKPSTVMGEQVAGTSGLSWLDGVFTDLERIDYAVASSDLVAAFVRDQTRSRLFWLADSANERQPAGQEHIRVVPQEPQVLAYCDCADGKRRAFESGSFPLADGLPEIVGRLRGYGNAIVPQVAAEVIRAYMDVVDH